MILPLCYLRLHKRLRILHRVTVLRAEQDLEPCCVDHVKECFVRRRPVRHERVERAVPNHGNVLGWCRPAWIAGIVRNPTHVQPDDKLGFAFMDEPLVFIDPRGRRRRAVIHPRHIMRILLQHNAGGGVAKAAGDRVLASCKGLRHDLECQTDH